MSPLFNFFGGRKWFFTLLGVAMVLVWAWQTGDWSQDKLMLILGMLGVGVAGNALEDGLRRDTETIILSEPQAVEEEKLEK